ncbi:MAG: choice-of-anchor T family protein [Thermoplasmata archaeon]
MVELSRVCRTLLLALFLLMTSYTFLPEKQEVSAQVRPVIMMSLDPFPDVSVAPGSTGNVKTTLKITSQSTEKIRVSLTASIDIGSVTVDNPQPILQPSGSVVIQVSANIPIGNPMGHALVVINGRPSTIIGGILGETASVMGDITIKQYAKITVESEMPYIRLSGGNEQVGLMLKAYNIGNGNDLLRLEHETENQKDLSEKGWTVSIGVTSAEVVSKDFKNFAISITSPRAWWSNDIYMLKFIVKSDISQQLETLVTETYIFTVYVRGVGVPGFELLVAFLAIGIVGATYLVRSRKL